MVTLRIERITFQTPPGAWSGFRTKPRYEAASNLSDPLISVCFEWSLSETFITSSIPSLPFNNYNLIQQKLLKYIISNAQYKNMKCLNLLYAPTAYLFLKWFTVSCF